MLQKNLEYLDNADLKRRLSGMKIEESRIDMSYCMTPSNDYLIMKNDIPIDDVNNPREAIREHLKSAILSPMLPNDFIITFGLGMCYQLDEVFNNYPSRIFVYEPDTKLLHFVLSNVDISDHLKSGRVFIYDKLDDLISKLADMYIIKDKVEVVYLKNYAVVKSQELLDLTQKIYETCKSKTVDINTITRYSKFWLNNSLKNLGEIKSKTVYPLSGLEGAFIGQTALVIAAGPSLNENIQKIKENREKYVIFAVNKVLPVLYNNGITPDFAVCMDARFVENSIAGKEEYLSKISCIMNLSSDNDIIKHSFRKIFISFSDNDGLVKGLTEYNKFIKPQESGGSATTMAFVSAVKMGFTRIVLVGVDLAFKNNVAYSSGEEIDIVSKEKIKINNIEKDVVYVKSVTGEDVLTTEDYAAFINHFETLIKGTEYSEIYNTTSFGAAIPGVKNVKFEDIPLIGLSNTTAITLGEVQPFVLETSEWAQNELLKINSIIDLLSKNVFSPALISAIVKTPTMYQYMQADILEVLQSRMADGLAEKFMGTTKTSIKEVIELLQKNNLI